MEPKLGNRMLTIGDLADRTGVARATLRSWESRYGFPRPARLAGGHRRYSQHEVAAVLEVIRQRDAGVPLEAAVRRVTTETASSGSVYAELRRRHPELTPQLLSKTSLLALSRSIEDECLARAEAPVLFGAFQRQAFLRASRKRWIELARTARVAVVFADLATSSEPGGLVEVSLPHEAPLNREWIVICDSPGFSACLAAVELAGRPESPDSRSGYESVWTVDPRAVRYASRVAAALADDYRPGWREGEVAVLDEEPPAASADLRRASDLLNRMIGYLDDRVS